MTALQIFLSPAAGKLLIARALANRPDVRRSIMEHTVVVVAGSTNSYLASELLKGIGAGPFEKRGFYRGLQKPPGAVQTAAPRNEDLVIEKGAVSEKKTVYDVIDALGPHDIVFKGANAVHLPSRTTGIIVGNPTSGTIGPIQSAVLGRRVTLIHPVGVEKRVEDPVWELAKSCNSFGCAGFRLCPSCGVPYTELDALHDLCGVNARIMAGGGVAGYEGGCYFLCEGSPAQLRACRELAKELLEEPPYSL